MSKYERIKDLNLPHRAVVVYYYLWDRANKEGECWPAVPTIAREIRLSEKTVRRAILDLRKAKILETEQRYRTKGGNDLHLSTSHNGRLTIISIPLSICIIVSIAMLN